MTFQEPTTLDTYESICDYARRYSESLDDLRWILGDCANTVTSRYGDKTVESFARDIGQRKSTIYQYAKVADFYPPSLRRRISADMPNINYSHMRDGLRLNDVEKAIEWLNEVSISNWSADEAARKLTERLGHKVYDCYQGEIVSSNGTQVTLYVEKGINWKTGQKVTIRIKD